MASLYLAARGFDVRLSALGSPARLALLLRRSALPPVAALLAALAALRLRLQPLWDLADLAARRADDLNEE